MDQWPPEIVFPLTGLLAGLAGCCTESLQQKTITRKQAMQYVIYYGFAGSTLGMFCYRVVGKFPEVILALGMSVGLKVVAVNIIRTVAAKVAPLIPPKDEDIKP